MFCAYIVYKSSESYFRSDSSLQNEFTSVSGKCLLTPSRENIGSTYLFILHARSILSVTCVEKFLNLLFGGEDFQYASDVLLSVVKFSASVSNLVLLHTAC